MTRRWIMSLAAAAAVVTLSAGSAEAARIATVPVVDGKASFRIENATGGQQVQQILALIVPPGMVGPPTDRPEQSPLTFNPLTSNGFNGDELNVLLFDGESPITGEQQKGLALGLDFGTNGFAPGGTMDFLVSISPGSNGSELTLQLVDPTPTSISFGTPVPEPASIALWALMGAGAALAWRRRRSG